MEAYLAIFVRTNDFQWHYDCGRAFLAGNPYAQSGEWYPLGRMMLNGLVATCPILLARSLCFLLALWALFAVFGIWERWLGWGAGAPGTRLPAATLTLLLLYPYVVRDLDDCGLQLFLLFFLSAGGYACAKGRPVRAGFWLATAATYKATPILFLPVVLWKRQWRAAGWMVLFLVLWNLIPAAHLGWRMTKRCHAKWWARATSALATADPSANSVEPARHQNQNMQLALARYLVSYPPDHALYLAHPLFVQFGVLDAQSANVLVKGSLLVLGAVFLCFVPPRLDSRIDRSRLAYEWSALLVLCAILSPFCWLQHLVLLVPAVYGVFRHRLAVSTLAIWQNAVLVTIALVVLLLQRDCLGRELSRVILSYKLDTLVALLAITLTLSLRPAGRVAKERWRGMSFEGGALFAGSAHPEG